MLLKTLYSIIILMTGLNMMLVAQYQKVRSGSPELIFAEAPFDGARKTQNNVSTYLLVRLKSNTKQADFKSNHVEIVRRLNNGYAIIKSNNALPTNLYVMIDTILYANNLWKLSDDLLKKDVSVLHEYTINVSQEKRAAVFNALSAISKLKFKRIHESTFVIECTHQSILNDVIPINGVLSVGIENYNPTVESRVLDLNLEPNTVNRVHHAFPDLDGDGVTLSIKEQAYDPNDIDIDGRHIASPLMAPLTDPHATEMATIAVGAGNSFVTGRGVAKAAHVTSSDFINLFPDPDADFQSLGAWTQNHSYGTVVENFYGTLAEAYDQSTNRNPQLLHVFSSGNKGVDASTTGTFQGISGIANVTGNFKMSKNALVVGSVDTIGREIFFSSRGPAFDGRIKPEVVTYSTAGTSNSAALVSGIALLMQESYQESIGELLPSALLKALLINSAQDAGSPGVDFITGYGNVDSYRCLENLLAGQYFSGIVNQGETKNIILPVPANAKNLKVTLVWNDPAAAINSNIALVNDLDLVVSDPSNATWLPWVLDASPDVVKLKSPAIRNTDHLNNVEQVSITTLSPGNYTISITGFDIPEGPQQYYVAYQWDEANEFDWSFPTASDNMPYNGETSGYFRWKSTLTSQVGRLEYSVDNGNTWEVIRDGVDLSKGYYRWLPPELNTSALARMVVGSDFYMTDRFTISRPIAVEVGFNCSDSVMLQWNAVVGAVGYDVYTFNNLYLESITSTSDTSFIFNKSEFPSKLYAVQTVLADAPAIRSYTFDYTQQGVECFVRNFVSEVFGTDGILLKLQLGSLYGVEQIFFERSSKHGFEIVGSLTPSLNRTFQFLDDRPIQGYNYHRARIVFDNGEEVITEVAENFFLTEEPYAVFPNPVKHEGDLNIFVNPTQPSNAVFRLFGTDGRQRLEQGLISDREVINLSTVYPGLYFYSIENNQRIYSGKILVIEK